MARGWESKAVEEQQAESVRGRRGAQPGSQDEAGPAPERATLMLARARALADLQLACAPAHRAMLEHAIRDLEARLGALT